LDNGNRYVNVDMSNPDGIEHAKDLGFGASGLADVAITSWFHDTASIFDVDHKGRCFVLLRHPIRRAVSMFYYLKDATWEHTYSEVYQEMDINEYATSQYAEDNWMVRFLTNEMSGNVYDRHLDLAKEVLESKCLVGIMEDFAASIKRFDRYFGWSKIDFGGPVSMTDRGTCVARVIKNPDNAHPHPTVEEDGEVWNLLLEKNSMILHCMNTQDIYSTMFNLILYPNVEIAKFIDSLFTIADHKKLELGITRIPWERDCITNVFDSADIRDETFESESISGMRNRSKPS